MRITDIFSKDKTDLNLTKAIFKVMPTHTGKKYIDTIFFQYNVKLGDNIFTYKQLSEMNDVVLLCEKRKSKNRI